jgi:putative membrane protein
MPAAGHVPPPAYPVAPRSGKEENGIEACASNACKMRRNVVPLGSGHMYFMAIFNEACILSSAICMAIGWVMIRRNRVRVHRRLMLTAVTLTALFFVSYVAKTVFVGDTTFGGPASLRPAYQTFLQIHSVLATVSAVLGIFTLRFASLRKFGKHRRISRWTAVAWFITAITGLAVFLLLYVIFPPGPTHNMFQTWTGR